MDLREMYAVELAGVAWTKSSYTANNNDCVETAPVPGIAATAVRDSKNTQLPATRVSRAAWAAFVTAAKAGTLTEA
ncbi:DUF397 domain-containing protein [Embleya sp. NBC_00896]|uniref:DUF397 domain-containing protein n=1 Tax=Embleya sp. NBC_00896 TaxID=2975961 RepID=UPI00386F8A95|nr:DUF397 domain-containing protein [Embleya sp. NBC_00896]